MNEQVVQEKTGQEKTTVTSTETNQAPKAEDLLKRIGSQKTETSQPKKEDEITYNSSDIEKIQDPMAKKMVQDLYGHLQKGFNKKFEDLARERKALEQERQNSNTWTPERIQATLNDPSFIQASKQVIQNQQSSSAPSSFEGTTDEWSALSDVDKARWHQLESKVNMILTNQDRLEVNQADERIKQQFPDYESSKVDSFQNEILSNRLSQGEIRELIWKAMNFKRYVENAYRFGQEDRNGTLQEKLLGSTQTGSSIQTSEERPMRQDGEAPQAWFSRLAKWNLDRDKRARAQNLQRA